MTDTMRFWASCAATAWRQRRTEDGGLTDDVAMMAILVAVAVMVGVALLAVLTGAVDNLNFDVPGTGGGG
jgi:hypothetical protein